MAQQPLTGPGGIPILPPHLDHGIDITDEQAEFWGISESEREEIRRGRPKVPAWPAERKMQRLDRERERRHAEHEQRVREDLGNFLAREWAKMTADWPATRQSGPPGPTCQGGARDAT